MTKNTMFGVILSPEPDVVLALLFYPLQRKHTLIQTIGEAVSKCQMLALACCVTVCVLRECQNWVTLPLKIYIKFSCWVETEKDVSFTETHNIKSPNKSKHFGLFSYSLLTFYKCK